MKIHRTVLLLFPVLLCAQTGSINNTLGIGGSFAIKYGSTTYFNLAQSNGLVTLSSSLSLPATTNANVGVIDKGASRFLHNYGLSNTFLGVSSGNFSLSGYENVGIGDSTLSALTTGNENAALGYLALSKNLSGYLNTAAGCQALSSNTSGYYNTACGASALLNNADGANNSAFGVDALENASSASENSAFGAYALENNSTATCNTAVGFSALSSATTGGYNTAIGCQAGSSVITGANNTLLGYQASPGSASDSNEICLGNSAIKQIRCAVSSISAVSDARDKRNIRDLPLGLDFLMTVRPRLYNWDRREWYKDEKSDGSKMEKTPTAGFVAQEMDKAESNADADWLRLVVKSNPNKLEITPGNLLPVMVKAIQDLKTENDALKNELALLRAGIAQQVKEEVNKALTRNSNGSFGETGSVLR